MQEYKNKKDAILLRLKQLQDNFNNKVANDDELVNINNSELIKYLKSKLSKDTFFKNQLSIDLIDKINIYNDNIQKKKFLNEPGHNLNINIYDIITKLDSSLDVYRAADSDFGELYNKLNTYSESGLNNSIKLSIYNKYKNIYNSLYKQYENIPNVVNNIRKTISALNIKGGTLEKKELLGYTLLNTIVIIVLFIIILPLLDTIINNKILTSGIVILVFVVYTISIEYYKFKKHK